MFKTILIVLSISIIVQSASRNQPLLELSNAEGNSSLVEEFGQCGGHDWEGSTKCQADLVCVKQSKYYSQCLLNDPAVTTTTGRLVSKSIPPDGKCHGENISGKCATGTACFIQIENVHGECKTHCPQGWFCTYQKLPEWAPCGGEGYVGLTNCKEGLQCLEHSKWYHECRSECPQGWKC